MMVRRLGMVQAAVLAAGVLAVAPEAGAATVEFGFSAPTALSDFGAAGGDLFYMQPAGAASGVVTDVDVTISGLTHARPEDLDLELVSPDGTAVPLMSDSCGSTAVSGVTLTFDDDATATPSNGSPACTNGRYKPSNSGTGDSWLVDPTDSTLAAFVGENPNGAWALATTDDTAGQSGSVTGFTIKLTTGPAVVTTVPSTTDGTPASAYPLPIVVTGQPGAITDLDVTLPGLTSPAADRLDFALVAPDGTAAMLMSDVCGNVVSNSVLHDVTLTLDDEAAGPLPTTGPCPSGRYRPADVGTDDPRPAPAPQGHLGSSLSTFDGHQANGTWLLYVTSKALDKYETAFLVAVPQLTFTLRPPDTTAPDTKPGKKPKSSAKTRAKLTFSSSEPGATFECKVDKKAYSPCTSPLKLKHLKPGKHTVLVRAVDTAGNADPSPTKVRWRVLPKDR